MHYLYILKNQKSTRHYIGIAANVFMRLQSHNSGKVISTKAFIPWHIVHIEVYNTKIEAAKRERELKHNAWKRNELFKSV